ncbi:DgyrCDS8991 [Dimorphilus gyrociliatus]|uniref:Transporter n=1 Tax=Dimorphilus gyrociliatus TaxID=2664684 RepID=A0A7I8VY39_9ANNE|nr:DgyrCDS8991 [Dimorphilus gyrociliatus]
MASEADSQIANEEEFIDLKKTANDKAHIEEGNQLLTSDPESAKEKSDLSSKKNRGEWGGKFEFLLSCLSYAVGLGNLWRFPYLCYKNGGGAFLIPYTVMLLVAGIPLFFLELSFGQKAKEGVISIWKICPLFQGIGWGMFLVSLFISIYYNMIIAWTLFYLGSSFSSDVPWRHCENDWNTGECGVHKFLMLKNCTEILKGLFYNNTCLTRDEIGNSQFEIMSNWTNVSTKADHNSIAYPSDEFFHRNVLQMSEGFHDFGTPNLSLSMALLGAWILVGICLSKGIKSAGRAVYFTATFPYLVLIILLIRGLTLEGSFEGIKFYLTPEWSRLATAKVWGDAAVQIFFSLSPCWGGLITLASYNKTNNNCLRDALVVSIANCLTSFFAGFVIFGIIGFMANEMGLDVGKVAKSGAGLAFIVYPEVVSRLPISPLWAILFFLMLLTLGLGTQFAVVTTVHTTLLDVFPSVLRRGKRPMLVMLGICIFGYLVGLSCTTRGGIYLLQLIDNYAASYSVLIIGLFECSVLSWVYGVDKYIDTISDMLTFRVPIVFKYMWKYVTPIILIAIMLFTWIDYQPSYYGSYIFPTWADSLGWTISMTSVSAIPIVAFYKLFMRKSVEGESFMDKIRDLCKPDDTWGKPFSITKATGNKELYQTNSRSETPSENNEKV